MSKDYLESLLETQIEHIQEYGWDLKSCTKGSDEWHAALNRAIQSCEKAQAYLSCIKQRLEFQRAGL